MAAAAGRKKQSTIHCPTLYAFNILVMCLCFFIIQGLILWTSCMHGQVPVFAVVMGLLSFAGFPCITTRIRFSASCLPRRWATALEASLASLV
jgi:hypothetical protein